MSSPLWMLPFWLNNIQDFRSSTPQNWIGQRGWVILHLKRLGSLKITMWWEIYGESRFGWRTLYIYQLERWKLTFSRRKEISGRELFSFKRSSLLAYYSRHCWRLTMSFMYFNLEINLIVGSIQQYLSILKWVICIKMITVYWKLIHP